jgi:hypothetical protein
MSPDPFFNLDSESACQLSSKCEEVCPWSNQKDACGARIHPDCLQVRESGLTRVGLSVSTRDWFAALSQMGEVLQIARNLMAAMGQVGPLPVLMDWGNPILPRDAFNSFTPNLAEFAHLWAARQRSPVGVAYGLEATDLSGFAFHRIFLVNSAQREWFEQFVINHQSPPMEAGHWFSPNHVSSVQRCHTITNRAAFLRSRRAQGDSEVRQLPIELVSIFLIALANSRLQTRTTHYHRALIRAAVWMPDVLEPALVENSAVEFLHGDGIGLQINLSAINGFWLWQGRYSSCDKEHWTIEMTDANDNIGLAFTAGNEQLETSWREFLKGCLR